MTVTPDFTKFAESFLAGAPADMKAFGDVYKNAADVAGKFGKIALAAAEKNAELSQAWTKETLAKLEGLTEVSKDPADYAKLVSDFSQAQAQATPEKLAAFAEVAKKAQMDAVELMLATGKEVQAEAAGAIKNATKKND